MIAETDQKAASHLTRLVNRLPGGEDRAGQLAMCEAVEAAITRERHLLVQGGTGTGKSLAYLVPAVLSGRRVVVATATKALQEQLINKDLPFLAAHLGVPVRAALLKGRGNYLCQAALADALDPDRPALLGIGDKGRLAEIAAWAGDTTTGDQSDLPFAVRGDEWARVSVTPTECPGARACPVSASCFAERARDEAAEADVVVVNTHLYCIDLASGRAVLPPHDVVIIDEAHALEGIASDTLGLALSPGRFEYVARGLRRLFTDPAIGDAVEAAGRRVADALEPHTGRRIDPRDGDIGPLLVGAAEAVQTAVAKVLSLDTAADAAGRRERLLQLGGHLVADLRVTADLGAGRVAWVEGASTTPTLRVAPVEIGTELASQLFGETTAILTSATLTVGGRFEPLAARLGLAPGTYDKLDAGSPFDYEHQALLYCAAHLPDPRASGYEAAMLEELEALVRAAGGRTLALFTSRRAMEAAAAHLSDRVPWRLLVQDQLPRPLLQSEFLADETSCLLATMGFWQGFDAPGRTCSLVVIDRLPFARPDDPLAEARREAAARAGQSPFGTVDLPHAAVLLAQGAGRLIRSGEDRGVVAVLDRRLAAAGYRWTLVRSLPPMRRTKDRREVESFLAVNNQPEAIESAKVTNTAKP